jgi:hypothetical protein
MAGSGLDVGTTASVRRCGAWLRGVARDGWSGGGGSAATARGAAEKRAGEDEGSGEVLFVGSAQAEECRRRCGMRLGAQADFNGDRPG